MSLEEDFPASRNLWIGAALAVVGVATIFRIGANFASPYPPGTDAGYYPLQTRTWLLQGHLMYSDLPLFFWLNAALAKVLVVFGIKLDDAVLLASRVLDSVIEPWVGAGVLALGYVWADGHRKALLGCTAAAVIAVLSPPVIRMLSDFEKNSAGFVFMCGAIWACRSAMEKRSARAWLVLSLFLVLAAMTHIGAFAVTMGIVVVALLVWSLLSLKSARERGLAIACFAGVSVFCIALLAVFDPSRASKLMRAPVQLFRAVHILVLPIPILIVAAIPIAIAIRLVWRDRLNLPPADIAVVTALAAATLFAVLPKSFDYFDRLFLMGMVPASLLLAFTMARLRNGSHAAGFALFLLAFLAAVGAPPAVQRPLMNKAEAAEMRDVKKQISDPASTLVIAPHGLEWWAGYFLETPVRNASVSGPLNPYRRILYLRNTIDCPPEIASPFGMPPIDKDAARIYFGHYVEVYEAK